MRQKDRGLKCTTGQILMKQTNRSRVRNERAQENRSKGQWERNEDT